MNNSQFHLLIIDDNPDIHRDFIKILNLSHSASQLNEFDSQLFGDSNAAPEPDRLPDFKIDTATQGEEGVLRVKEALESGNPYALAFIDIHTVYAVALVIVYRCNGPVDGDFMKVRST